MLTPFVIYVRAMLLYALFTIPALVFPPMYALSLILMIIYGWLACIPFMICYWIISIIKMNGDTRMFLLAAVIPGSVWVAYIFLTHASNLGAEEDVFLLFPLAGVLAGWVSLFMSAQKIRNKRSHQLLSFEEEPTDKTNASTINR